MVSLDRLMPLDDDMSAEELSEWVKLGREYGEIDFSKINPKTETTEKQESIHINKSDESLAHV